MIEFSNLSIDITKKINKLNKKNNGIYFTPYSIIKKNLELLEPYLSNIKFILEPSCGSCQFIDILEEKLNNINIIGIEYNKEIYDIIKNNNYISTNIYNYDFLLYENNKKFDLIIGNPPYYVINKNNINKKYLEFIDGRPNIFSLFILKSLNLLDNNGILSFILPKNFINCLYYNKLRKYIYDNYTILNIINCDNNKYLETLQETIIFIIQNKKPNNSNNDFSIILNKFIIFNSKENINILKELYKNSTNLHNLNFKVYVGNLVWNQHKNLLSNDNSKTRIIYSSNINDNNTLSIQNYKNNEKKNFINKKGFNELLLVVNRGNGVSKYKFKYSIIDVEYDFLIENHLIYIKYNNNSSKDNLLLLYNKIINSFENKKTKEFINIYFGNNAINTTELNYIFPIYDI